MNGQRHRPLAVGNLRAFEAVARLLGFSAAAEELHVTQSAMSRQIKALEDEIGTSLFTRGTRHVELTPEGVMLLRAVAPALDRLDAGVRQVRQLRGRKVVSVTTFASFSSLWLIPRLEAYQRSHPDIDIRVSANDSLIELEDSDIDVALRHCSPARAPVGGHRMFGDIVTPVVSPWLAEQAARGQAPPLTEVADLAQHSLAEEDDPRPVAETMSWRYWLATQNLASLQPRRWLYLSYTYQQVQTALTGQAVALARMPLVAQHLARGELVEPFDISRRVKLNMTYWLLRSRHSAGRPEVTEFVDWILEQARETSRVLGEVVDHEGPTEAD